MISFIIIGRNIENTIAKCVESVIRFVENNNIVAYEIIYVDSASKDKTIEIARKYPIKIFQIIGQVNAAIGRNVGAKKAIGDILFFIDGDMEILSDFYPIAFGKNSNELKYSFSSGTLVHKHYNSDFEYLYSSKDKNPQEPVFNNTTGGLFIIEKKMWQNLNGMDERLIRNQDIDFGLRMSKTGIPVKLYNHQLAVHHTVNYFDNKRVSNFYFTKALFSTGLLMRKHLFYSAYLRRYRNNLFYVIILFISFCMLAIETKYGIAMLFLYLFIQLGRTIKNFMQEKLTINSFVFKSLFSFYTLFGFLFYYPKVPKYKISEV